MNKGQIIISTHTPPLKTEDQTVDSNHLNRDFQATVDSMKRLGYEQTSISSDTIWTGENLFSKVQVVAIKDGR